MGVNGQTKLLYAVTNPCANTGWAVRWSFGNRRELFSVPGSKALLDISNLRPIRLSQHHNRFGKLISRSLRIHAISVRFEDKVTRDNDVKSPPLPHTQGRLNIEVTVNDPLPRDIGCILPCVLQGAR